MAQHRQRLPRRSGPLTRDDVEGEILRLVDELEVATEEHAALAAAAAQAESDWKKAEALHIVQDAALGRTSEYVRRSSAIQAHALLFEGRHLKAAVAAACLERVRTLRAVLDAVRSIAANVRSQS